MNHTYIFKALIGSLILLIITFCPMCWIIYCIVNHAWGMMILAIAVQVIAFFVLLVLFTAGYGFLDKGPHNGFVEFLLKEINYFYKRGYKIKMLYGSGSSHPGVIMVKTGMPDITLVFNYHPMRNYFFTTLIFSQLGRKKKYRYDCEPDMQKFAKEFDPWFGDEDKTIETLKLSDFIGFQFKVQPGV